MSNRIPVVRTVTGVLLTLLLLTALPCAYGQDSSNGANSANNTNNGNNGNARPSSLPSPLDQSYSASLGSGQAIPLTQGASAQQNSENQNASGIAPEIPSQFFYGGTASTVYVDTYNTASIEHTVSGVVSPYFGVYLPTRTGGVTLQYLGTYAPDDAFSGDFEAYHTVSVNAVGAFTRRWYWGLSSTGNYGSATAQFEGPLTYMLVGLIPVVDPIEPGQVFLGRTVAFAQNAGKLGWRKSERDRFELTAYHLYSDLSASDQQGGLPADRSNAVGAKLDYSRDVTRRFKFDVYAQEEHVIESSCNLYGGGAGISAQLSYSWHLDLSGGPEWTSANCGRQTNYNLYGALVKSLRGQAKAYLVGWHYYNTAFQTPGTFQDAIAVGVSQPLGNRFTVQADAGYFRGDPLLVTAVPFQGYFAAPLVRYKVSDSTSISAGYRIFHATAGGTVPGNLHYATISLEWHPKPHQLGR